MNNDLSYVLSMLETMIRQPDVDGNISVPKESLEYLYNVTQRVSDDIYDIINQLERL